MEFRTTRTNEPKHKEKQHWQPDNIVEVEQKNLLSVTEQICKECRYPLLALRILIHCIANMDSDGRITVSARQLAKSMDVHYDTISKCFKYLRQAGILRIER